MIATLRPPEPLPDLPDQQYGLSDVMTPRELVWDPGFLRYTYYDCLLESPERVGPRVQAFGWTQAGRLRPVASILVFSNVI